MGKTRADGRRERKRLRGQALWLSPGSIRQTACKVITNGRRVTGGQLQEEMDRFTTVKGKLWSQQTTITHPKWEFQGGNGPLTTYLADGKSMKSRKMSAVA